MKRKKRKLKVGRILIAITLLLLIIGLFIFIINTVNTKEEPKELELNEIENINEELKVPSKYMKTLMENYGIEPKNLKTTRKMPKIKGAKFNSEPKAQETIEQTKSIDEEEKIR